MPRNTNYNYQQNYGNFRPNNSSAMNTGCGSNMYNGFNHPAPRGDSADAEMQNEQLAVSRDSMDQYNRPTYQSNNNFNSLPETTTPETLSNPEFFPGYLRMNIGRWVRIEFLVGQILEQRVGILKDVGASYVILDAIEPDTEIICDLYSIKFVTVVYGSNFGKLLI